MNLLKIQQRFFLSAMLLCLFLGYGQESAKLPEMTPPSPEAYGLTKYGDMPINEFTGMATASIPIYTYKAGHLQLPISLNYAGAGVKVDQLSTWTGVNWTLNAGGVIARTVNHNPDEYVNKRYFVEDFQGMTLANGTNDAIVLNYMFAINDLVWDIKPDVFNFSFAGHSGSFYLDKDYIPRFTKIENELKIEIVGTDTDMKNRLRFGKTFCITTPDGVRYYFGGEATENSFLTYTGHENITYNSPTAFYLYMIQHPIKGTILLEYETIANSYQIKMSQSQSYTKITAKTNEPPVGNVLENEHTCDDSGLESSIGIPITINNKVFNAKILKRIYSSDNTVSIDFNTVNGPSAHFKKALTSIEVKNTTTLLKKATFTYFYPGGILVASRFFLTKVEFNKEFINATTTGRKYEEYGIEYNDPGGLPQRFSFSQDHAGYFNGKPNQNLFPQTQHIAFKLNNQNHSNRNPVFSYASKGTLTKLTYPTGGYTQFEYEAVPAKDYDHQNASLSIWRNNPALIPSSKTSSAYLGLGNAPFDPNGSPSANPGLVTDQELIVNIFATATDYMGHTDRINFKVTDLTTATSVLRSGIMGPAEIGTGLYHFNGTFTFNLLKGHSYNIEFYNDYNSSASFDATAYFSFIKGFKIVDDIGIRVKRITDFDTSTNKALTKRYYYESSKKLNQNQIDKLDFVEMPNYVRESAFVKCCRFSDNVIYHTTTMFTFYRATLHSSPLGDFLEDRDKKYTDVTISYGGDNFEQGGIEKTFFYEKNHFNFTFKENDAPPGNSNHGNYFEEEFLKYTGNANDAKNGMPIKTTQLIKKNDVLFKISQEENSYDQSILNGISGITGGICYLLHCQRPNEMYDNFKLGQYSLFSKKIELVSTVAKEFIDPVPVTELNELSYRTVTSVENYEYGALAGLPIKNTFSTSDNNLIKEIHTTYVNQGATLSGIDANQANAYNSLFAQNRISEPVQTEQYENTNGQLKKLSTQRTLYKNWGNNPNAIYPEVIQASKGTASLEDRITFLEYDSQGNINLVSMKNGPRTRYFYNNRNQVIQKVVNYPASIIPPSIPEDPFEPTVNPGTESSPCEWHLHYPSSQVTDYHYHPVTHMLDKITDPNCQSIFYEYDALNHLKRIRNEQGEIIKEFDYNYRTQ